VRLDDDQCKNVRSPNLRIATESDEEAAKIAAEAAKSNDSAKEMGVDESEVTTPSNIVNKSEGEKMEEDPKVDEESKESITI